jgi:outer membrane lipoprotein-sorting protein
MNCMRVLGVLALGGLLAATAFAQPADEILEKARKKYDALTDVEVRFTQAVKFPVSRVEQRVSGVLQMRKGNHYRVETGEMTVVTDGTTVWSYSRATHQLLIDRFNADERTFSPERILTAAPEDFSAVLLGKEKVGAQETFVLKLVPSSEGFITTLKLWIAESDYLTRKVEMVDASGKETTYLVSDLRANAGIPESRFTLPVPEGAEVVDLR